MGRKNPKVVERERYFDVYFDGEYRVMYEDELRGLINTYINGPIPSEVSLQIYEIDESGRRVGYTKR